MREIKFRAWDGEELREVDLYWFEENMIREWPGDNNSGWTGKYELMQFTGLHDKNGTEVYEGDIVKGIQHPYNQDIEDIAKVEYDEEMQLMPFHYITGYDGELWMHTAKGGFEVIGNIYENPELLTD